MMYTGEPLCPWEEGETRVNKMVFIGRNLDRASLTEEFTKCLA
jgi:hypothetical protein